MNPERRAELRAFLVKHPYPAPTFPAREIVELLDALDAAETEARQARELNAANEEAFQRLVDPITGQRFFMIVGKANEDEWHATFGGPYDSYTLCAVGEDGEFERERFDHDAGRWAEPESLGVRLLTEEDECDAMDERDALAKRVAELEGALKSFCVLVGNANHRGGFDESSAHALTIVRNMTVDLFPEIKWDEPKGGT